MKDIPQTICEAELTYPRSWTYKVIGLEKHLIQEAIEMVFASREFLAKYSNQSRTGKYHSWQVDLVVEDEQERNSFYMKLKNHTHIKMVI